MKGSPLPRLLRAVRAGGFLALAACMFASTPLTARMQDPQDPEDDVIYIRGDRIILDLPEEEGPNSKQVSLYDLMRTCHRITRMNFIVPNQQDERSLKDQKIKLLGRKDIPIGQFYDFFQIILKLHKFACVEEGDGDLQVVQIVRLVGEGVNSVKSSIKYVPPEGIAEFANRPASLIVTILPLEYIEPTQAQTMLQRFFTAAQLEGFAPLGGPQDQQKALMVIGFGPTVNAIARLLREVDIPPKVELPEMAIIPLVHAAADEIQPILDTFFRGGATGRPAGQPNTPGASQIDVQVDLDARRNALIIRADRNTMPEIRDLIAQLDVSVEELKSNYQIIELKNVSSEDLQQVLEDFLREANQAQNQVQGGGAQSQQRREQRPVVIAEPNSNSLLISASKTRMAEIMSLVRRLDKRQEQVLIETALVELTSSDGFNWATELGLAKVPAANETTGFGFSNFGLSTLQDTDGDGFADTRLVNTGLTGITGGILDGQDFALPLLINTLRTRTNANILSIPSILVSNNTDATIRTKDEIPTTTQNNIANAGTTVTFNGFQEAGITLEISPSISSDYYLRLNLRLEVSQFTGAFDSATAIPPPRVTREVKTQVFLPSGSTMVIGGITIDNQTETKNAIPILGDIPILSFLFGSRSENENKTTLYFFATPHILRDKDFADLREHSARAKQHAADVIGYEKVLRIDPRFNKDDPTGDSLPSEVFEILPSEELTETLKDPGQPAEPANGETN